MMAIGMDYEQVVSTCATDDDFNTSYTMACKTHQKPEEQRPYPTEDVKTLRKLGYRVVANFDVKTEELMKKEDTKSLTAEDVGEGVHAYPSPFTGSVAEGVITKAELTPFVQIQVYCDTEVVLGIENLPSSSRCRPDQTTSCFEKMRKVLSDSLPVPLRGNKHPPTMKELRLKARSVLDARGQGEANPPRVPALRSVGGQAASAASAVLGGGTIDTDCIAPGAPSPSPASHPTGMRRSSTKESFPIDP